MKPLILLFFCIFIQALYAEKRALIIAIGNYPTEKTGIRKINSGNDVPLIKNTLIAQGFKPEAMVILKDSTATKAGVLKSFNELVAKTKSGDNIVIAISAHGSRIPDDNGDELDMRDESIVCYDAKKFSSPGYKGENHLRDDEIDAFLTAIRKKAGNQGDVLMLVDACHSGSITRGTETVRGISEDFLVEENLSQKNSVENKSFTGFVNNKIPKDESGWASLVVISAAKSDESNTETRDKVHDLPVGSLSYAFARSMVNLKSANTYRDLFGKIQAEINSYRVRQTPAIEGNGIDRQMFGGKFLCKPQYFSVSKIFKNDTVEISGGTFSGIFKGSKMSLFLSGDEVKLKPYRTGEVIAEDNFFSKVLLDKGVNKIDTTVRKILQVVVSEKILGNFSLKVYGKKRYEPLKDFPLVTISNQAKTADLLIEEDDKGLSLILASSGENIAAQIPSEETDKNLLALKAAIKKYAQSIVIKNLQLDNFMLMADMDVVPIPTSFQNTEKIDSALIKDRIKGGALNVKAGQDALRITLTNIGSRPFFVNILDISCDGTVAPVFPTAEMDASDYKLFPSKSITREFTVAPPYGNESLKVILSEDDINLGVVINTNGTQHSTRGVGSPLENLFRQTFNIANTRGTTSPMSGLDKASTIDFTFKIIEY